jgi:GT2 family glycosyltransferase
VSNGCAVAIVPVYDGGDALVEAVDALLRSQPRAPRVLLVVNRDGAGVSDRVARKHGENVELLRPASNLGFAGGVNCGIAHALTGAAPSEAIVLVNQDCIVEIDAIHRLVATLDDPSVGIAGALLFDRDAKTVQHAGGRVHPNGLTDHLGRGGNDAEWTTRGMIEADYVTGALCAFRADVWRSYGPFDAGYHPVYFEEVDFCSKLRRAGLRVVVEPGVRGVHAEASSSGRGSALFLQRYHGSRMRFAARHLLRDGRMASALAAEARWLLRLRTTAEIIPALKAYARLPQEIRAGAAARRWSS